MSASNRRQWIRLAAAGALYTGLGVGRARAEAQRFPSEWRFGDVRITKIIDVVEPFDAARAFPGQDLSEFAREADWLPEYFYDPVAKAIIFSFHSYLLRTPRITMIVDTAFGEDTPDRSHPHHGAWLANLAAAGLRPENVDFVTCTHFHGDHVGWNTRRLEGKWRTTFPRARYLFRGAEIDNLQARGRAANYESDVYGRSILPVLESGQADRIDGAVDVADGIRIVPAPGHTPGHQCIEISSRGRRAVLSGDILHNPIEVLHPEWSPIFDEDKEAALVQRRRFLDAHCDVDVTVFAAHFAGPTAGRIVTEKGRRIFRPLPS